MARGRYHVRRGSGSQGSSSSGRGLVDEPIDTSLDKHTPTPPLGDDRDETDVDTHDQAGLPRTPCGPNRPQPPSTTISSGSLFHPVTGRFEINVIFLFILLKFFRKPHTNI